MIVLEGPDGSGKTTLANRIGHLWNVPVIHSPGLVPEFICSAMLHHASNPQEMIIYDRFWFSEFIYGPILRGEMRWPQWLMDMMTRVWLPKVKPCVIYCWAHPDVLRETVVNRPEMKGVPDNIDAIAHAYHQFFNETRWETFRIQREPGLMDRNTSELLMKLADWRAKRSLGI